MSVKQMLYLNYCSPNLLKQPLRILFSISSMAILRAYPTAKHLGEAKPKHIEKIVRSIKGNNFNIKEIQSLIETAQKSIYSGRAKHDRGLNLNILLTQVETLQNAIAQLDERTNNILSPSDSNDATIFPVANLLTIPGVGPKTLAAVLSVVGSDGQAFPDGKHLIGHIGFFPENL